MNNFNFIFKYVRLILFFILFSSLNTYAKDLVGSQFIVRDPVIGTGSEYSSSSNFKLFSGGDTLLTGIGSGSNFISHYGFLYFPYVNSGTLTSLQSGINVDLSWSSSLAGGGWVISGYDLGISPVSGGPYTYTSVGNVNNYTYDALPPGEYCFILKTLDALSNIISTSNESCINVQPVISFSLGSNLINLGTLTSFSTGAGSHEISVATNATNGFAVSYNGSSLRNESDPYYNIPVYTSDVSVFGTAGFGINLKTNATPSIGADPVSNYGVCGVLSEYDNSNEYSFTENVTSAITSVSASADCDYTVSYVGNISGVTNAGSYSSTITYIATSTF